MNLETQQCLEMQMSEEGFSEVKQYSVDPMIGSSGFVKNIDWNQKIKTGSD
jgi:hypothetical protein